MKDPRGCLGTRDMLLIYFLTPMGFSCEILVLYFTFVKILMSEKGNLK